MSDTPASPGARRLAAPGWLDGRLVLGVLLVLVSVVVGARVLSAADRSTMVWALDRDVSAGSQLTGSDLRQVRVRLFDNAQQYVAVAPGTQPTGYVVLRALGRGELLPHEALAAPGKEVDFREVTVPVASAHLPPGLQAQQQVDVWVTPESKGADPQVAADPPGVAAKLVLQGVTVMSVDRDNGALGGSTTVPVVLQVRPQEVAGLLSALSLGRVDLVRVPMEVGGPGRLDPRASTAGG